jgi:hypothetical protein
MLVISGKDDGDWPDGWFRVRWRGAIGGPSVGRKVAVPLSTVHYRTNLANHKQLGICAANVWTPSVALGLKRRDSTFLDRRGCS